MSPLEKRKAAEAGEQRAAFENPNSSGNDTQLTNTVKLAEFALVLGLTFKELEGHRVPCSCCGTVTALSTIEPMVLVTFADQIVVARTCPNCAVEAKASAGSSIQSFLPFTMAEVDQWLLSRPKWLDFALLRENDNNLFIRRPTFAETLEAQAAGARLAANSAVVVSPHGERTISRSVMPFPFPWRDEQEWWAGPIAAQSAIDLADAVGCGEVDMHVLRSKIVLSASTETMERLMRL